VAQGSAWVVQQAARLRHSVYMMYADLQQFFPRVNRACLRIGELAHGLPAEVVQLAAAIYGADGRDPRVARCVYDSEGGLSEAFRNGLGTLMGCPLSTDRARIFLNSLVVAIEAAARGVRLWGSGWTRHDDTCVRWERRLTQLMLADDWLGVFESVGELRAAWDVWRMWEPMTGARLGIVAAADKTVVTGVQYDERGRARTVPDPLLVTVDGRKVPLWSPERAYKHVGAWRSADASEKAGRRAFAKCLRRAVARVRGMRRPTWYQFMIVTEAFFGGYANFYLQSMFMNADELDKLEATWRNATRAPIAG
jgi:hypothetical protein